MDKSESPNDTVQINVEVRRETREKLKAKAKAANMTVAKFVAQMIEDTQVVAKPSLNADIKILSAWLGRLNSNINMITKWANTFKENAEAEVVCLRLASYQYQVQEIAQLVIEMKSRGFGKKKKTMEAE